MNLNPVTQLAAAGWFSIFVLQPLSVHAQGALTPPGPPGPTMKSLDQIEARTPVDATHTPGFLNSQFVISQPGSYYLTGNITLTNNNSGIFIQTNDVTLDLNGFVMTGTANTGDAIDVSSLAGRNVVIRNGTLRNWENGVAAQNGFCELERLRVYGCANNGFELGDHCIVRNCTAVNNGSGTGAGIQLGNGCVATDCLVSSNSYGIFGGSDCVISGCAANTNFIRGIELGDNGHVSKCIADLNEVGFSLGNNGQISQCVANSNLDTGFSLIGSGCIIKECVASGNKNDGIYVQGNSVVADNSAGGNSAGIYCVGSGNRIENNHTLNNIAAGIQSTGGAGADFIIRNTSTGNPANYIPTTGPTFGPVQTPATATSPWANF